MKALVLGASGGIGLQLVKQGITRGHAVVALARGSSSVNLPTGAELHRGRLDDVAFLREHVRGKDVVLSGLGLKIAGLGVWNKPEQPTFLTDSTKALLEAMKSEGVKKVLAVSSGGVGDSREILPAFFRGMIAVTALRHVFPRLEEMENLFLSSGLDVCMVRPSGLTDGERTGAVKVVRKFVGQAQISRADVADFMWTEAEKPAFSNRTPVITVTGGE